MDEILKQIVDLLKEKEGDEKFQKEFRKAVVEPAVDSKEVSLAWFNTDEGRAYLTAEKDKHFQKSLETWKGNNLEKLQKEYYDDRVVKDYPPEDPKDKQLRELKERLDKADKDRERYQLSESIRSYAEQEAKIPAALVPYLLADDEDSSKANVQKVKEIIDGIVQQSLEKEVTTRQTAGGGDRDKGLDVYTEAEIDALTQDQIIANRDKVDRSMQYLASKQTETYKV